MKCPDCGTLSMFSTEYYKDRCIRECVNPKCGCRYIVIKGEVEIIEHDPWDIETQRGKLPEY